MKYQLSFASVHVLTSNAVEVIINKDVEVSLEMVEECHQLLTGLFNSDFGILLNRVHSHDFSFEAKLCMASHENLSAIAVVNYREQDIQSTNEIVKLRKIDNWNLKSFSCFDLGYQQAQTWLKSQLPVARLTA